MLYVEIAIVAVLICLNGLLAMSELAVVSSRPARLKAMVERNVKGAASALKLGAKILGPAIIVERETSTVVTSPFDAVLQGDGTILLVRKSLPRNGASA